MSPSITQDSSFSLILQRTKPQHILTLHMHDSNIPKNIPVGIDILLTFHHVRQTALPSITHDWTVHPSRYDSNTHPPSQMCLMFYPTGHDSNALLALHHKVVCSPSITNEINVSIILHLTQHTCSTHLQSNTINVIFNLHHKWQMFPSTTTTHDNKLLFTSISLRPTNPAYKHFLDIEFNMYLIIQPLCESN